MKTILESDAGKIILTSSEACKILGVSRQRFAILAADHKIEPWLNLSSGSIWLRSDVRILEERKDRRFK